MMSLRPKYYLHILPRDSCSCLIYQARLPNKLGNYIFKHPHVSKERVNLAVAGKKSCPYKVIPRRTHLTTSVNVGLLVLFLMEIITPLSKGSSIGFLIFQDFSEFHPHSVEKARKLGDRGLAHQIGKCYY
jgi:hypothetical protein